MLGRRPAHDGRRWLGLAALALVASALIPAALALACNPQAYLTLDKTQYAPGESVRVSGSFFKNNAAVTVSIDRTGQSATVTTTGNGAFQATFPLPSNAPSGGYSVTAIGYEPNGDVVAGLPARGSFSVGPATPAPSAPTGGDTSAPSSTQSSTAPAPAAATPQASRPTRAPSSSTPSSGFRTPQVVDEPDVQKSSSSSTNRSTTGADAPRSSDRATSNGRAVFSGSVAPVPSISAGTPVAAATTAGAPASRATGAAADRSSRTAAASRGTSPQVAEQTATDDLWGALSPGRSPSVLPVAGDGVSVSSPRSGSQLALGAVLLGAGMLALIGGLAAGEVRRRRVRAR